MRRAALTLVLLTAACGPPPVDAADAGARPDGCQPAEETCNGVDDDCDGQSDEGFDLDTDPTSCGACGVACPGDSSPTETYACVAGACERVACPSDRRDCDADSVNGCESDLRSVDHCGACGAACGFAGAAASCETGLCEMTGCLDGRASCDGRAENGCEIDLDEDVFHCGACGVVCESDQPNSGSICATGACGIACDPGFGDCDTDPTNGCETSLSRPANCGGCGMACAVGRLCSGTSSAGYRCVDPPCVDPPTRCDNTCADLSSDAMHCGACDVACPAAPHARPDCERGACGFACDEGFGDCDGVESNGCETPLNTATDCTACGVACPTGIGFCTGARCQVYCPADRADCDADVATGCETELTTDPMSCGACGNVCPSGVCVAGVCQVCPVGFADCDSDLANGCELPVLSDANNCGACGNRCASGSCTNGVCEACPAGRADCDSDAATGCEAEVLDDAANCGACGNRCGAGETCLLGACTGCAAGCGCSTLCSASPGPCICDPGCACTMTCAAGTDCTPICEASANCWIRAEGAGTVQGPVCPSGATCALDAAGATEVRDATCAGSGTRCTFDCTNTDSCHVRCISGAACEIDCTGSRSCGFNACVGGMATCPGDVLVCNRACP